MKLDLSEITIIACDPVEIKAAEIFADEIKLRCGKVPAITSDDPAGGSVKLLISEPGESDAYSICCEENGISVSAHRLRGLIYGAFFILRKSVICGGKLCLTKDISGSYAPEMKLRGHNLSYTGSNNTCDAWTPAQYRRYILDMMAFGINTIENSFGFRHVSGKVMKMTFDEALYEISAICVELDLEYMVYYALDKKFTDEETVQTLCAEMKGLPRLSYLFLPGGDPGNLQAKDFVRRCRAIKEGLSAEYPDLLILPSAQAPHEYPDWGEQFKKVMAELPSEFGGIIYGPNHAMPLDELRRSISTKYPLYHYPDITHNVRCETPVHFSRDDWHFAWAATLSRESVNPRPREYRLFHQKTRQYFDGSVPYSEGVNDDVNKIVWSDLDFDFNCSLRESLRDYARFFMPGTDPEKIADLIFGLELNWEAPPEESFSVEYVYRGFEELLEAQPELYGNWRFLLLLFRAICDKIVRDRRIFELELISCAVPFFRSGNAEKAREILSAEFSDEYKANRQRIFTLAQKLFELIGIQLDVENFGGHGWERGCTLDTIDMPVTDRAYLLSRIEDGASPELLTAIAERNLAAKDELYFSFAEHGLPVCGAQNGEYYLDFNGDKNGAAKRPVCLTDGFDHFNFSFSASGLTGGDYILRIIYRDCNDNDGTHLHIAVNGKTVYDGECFGGIRDTEYEEKYLTEDFRCILYDIPADILENGCALLEMTEPLRGFIIYEFRFEKKEK